jgi:hypothetical protein
MLIKKSRDAKQLDQIQWIHKAMISINNKSCEGRSQAPGNTGVGLGRGNQFFR